MNTSRYANIDKFVNIQYIFLLARQAYSWLFQLAQMWKLLVPVVGLVDFLTPDLAKQFQRRRFLEIDHPETRIVYDSHVC